MTDRSKDQKAGKGRRWAVLRAALRLDQQDLAQRARVASGAVSEIEADHRTPEPETEERLMVGLGCTAAALGRASWLIRGIPRDFEESVATGLAAEALAFALEDLAFARIARRGASTPMAGCGTENLRRFPLRSFGVEELRDMIEDVPELQTPAFLEVLCEESERMVRIDPNRAEALAELALTLAGWMPLADEQRRPACQGHVLAFLGNARRVRGHWDRALETFEQAQDLQVAGGRAETELDSTRLLDLRASLLYDQRRLTEALSLLDEALEIGPRGLAGQARILIKRAKIYEELEQPEMALGFLEQAEPLLDQEPDPLLMHIHRTNVTVNLWLLGRAEEAERRLGELQALAEQLGNDLDKLRLRWLEARIDAALDRRHEAIEKLRGVRAEFQERKIAYDTGLVTLELSALLLEQGEIAEVKELAEEMLRIFAEQEVAQEAEKAFRIFCEAAIQESATLELVRRVMAQVDRG
jgi:tetratricopeptide (TPR) repeat protein/DNA-binding XRE family transcriptional regulator